MRHCFYHTDLGQNAVFHNFAIQIALIQYSGRSKHAWAFSESVQKISKITYTASWFSLLTKLAPNLQCTLNKLRFNIIKTSLCLFSIKWFYNDV